MIEQTKKKPQGTLEHTMNKQMEPFSFSLPISLPEEGKWLLEVTSFEASNSVFNKTDENNSLSFSSLSFWTAEDGEELINKLNKFLQPKSENDIEKHVKEVEKRGTRIEIENSGYTLAGFDYFKSEQLAELRRVRYKELEDMIYKMELTYDEILDMLDIKNYAGSTNGYTITPRMNEISDNNLMIKSSLPNNFL